MKTEYVYVIAFVMETLETADDRNISLFTRQVKET
jgi:hypothetical protein